MQPLLVNVQAQVRYRMEAIKLIPALVGDDFIFNDFDQCLEWIIENVEDKGA
jgi:SulP family sulfate permease